ncbi:hypothetical protein [Paenibacillus guangzhouensis]|uniref:hypothetical protein n=1 Tax=Paenibacillus guangzhouensis TaxID=1473112 RepID=UPI0012677712|nr:hypothetical protein [Paenibacillus guangzhouensis]
MLNFEWLYSKVWQSGSVVEDVVDPILLGILLIGMFSYGLFRIVQRRQGRTHSNSLRTAVGWGMMALIAMVVLREGYMLLKVAGVMVILAQVIVSVVSA